MELNKFEEEFYAYLGTLTKKPTFAHHDLEKMDTTAFLKLADTIAPELLPWLVHLLKTSKQNLFSKLMGDHEPENKNLVDRFFNKYQQQILSNEHLHKDFNPLLTYLPPETFDDLGFVQSRQLFFERQRSDVINEYLNNLFAVSVNFKPGESHQAWIYFWNLLVRS